MVRHHDDQPHSRGGRSRRQRLLNQRIDAIRVLAKARQARTDAQAQLEDAERTDAAAYTAGQRAGWTTDELRKVGFEEPRRRTPGRPRRPRQPRQGAASDSASSTGLN